VDMFKLLGAGIRNVRELRELSQEQAAARFREWGLITWRRTTVSQVELGVRKPSLPELLLVAGALNTTLADLIPDDTEGHVQLAPAASASVDVIRGVLSGDRDAWFDDPPNTPGWDYAGEAVQRAYQTELEAARLGVKLGLSKRGELKRAVAGVDGEAERRTADRLGVSVLTICVAAVALWGQTLTQEREARLKAAGGLSLSAAQRQAQRGHTTRVLQREIRDLLVYRGVIEAPSRTELEPLLRADPAIGFDEITPEPQPDIFAGGQEVGRRIAEVGLVEDEAAGAYEFDDESESARKGDK